MFYRNAITLLCDKITLQNLFKNCFYSTNTFLILSFYRFVILLQSIEEIQTR